MIRESVHQDVAILNVYTPKKIYEAGSGRSEGTNRQIHNYT